MEVCVRSAGGVVGEGVRGGGTGGGRTGQGRGGAGGLCEDNGGSAGLGARLEGHLVGGGQPVLGQLASASWGVDSVSSVGQAWRPSPQPANGEGGGLGNLCPEIPCEVCGVWYRPRVGLSCHSRCKAYADTVGGARESGAVGDLQDDQGQGVDDQSSGLCLGGGSRGSR